MSQVQRKSLNGEQAPLVGVYDAIVIGGGISGVSSARTLAAEGRRVALIEPTGTLGREITRAYNLFVPLSRFVEQSPTLHEYYNCLRIRKGWFDDQLDPTAAAVAFDDLLALYPVTVLFHVWPSRLLTAARKVTGLEMACKSGRARLEAPVVIDASAHGKIGRTWFRTCHTDRGVSMIHLLYNGISEECTDETVLTLPRAGELRVMCRPTFWKNEWRVTLAANHRRSRAEWLLLLDEALISLRERIPALRSGVLAHLGDDLCGNPELRISTSSPDERIAGYVINSDSEAAKSNASLNVPIFQGMLCNPDIADGLYLAGPWIDGFPYDPRREETNVVNAFILGDLAGLLALQQEAGYAGI